MKYTREFIGNLLSQLRNNYYKKKKTSIKIFDDCVIKLRTKLLSIVKYLRVAPSRPPKLIKKPDNVTNN